MVGLLLLSGAISLWALITYHGGWISFTSDRAAALTKPGQEYLRQGVGLIPIAFVYALTMSMGWRKGHWVVATAIGVTAVTLGVATGSKYEILYPLLATALAVHYLGARRIGIRHIAVLTLGVVLVFPVFNNLRHTDSLKNAWTATHWSPTEVGEHLMARFYGLDALTLCVRDTPGVMDFQYGSTITPVLTAWIPRHFFPEKPVVTFGKIFAETYMGDHFAGTGTSASPTLLGDAYINFHLPGVLITSVMYGIVLRALYSWTIRLHFGPPAVFLYLGVLPMCITAWEGAIGATLVLAAVKLTLLLLIIRIGGERNHDRLTPTSAHARNGRCS
jgi:oligosaccharide repeat unit polymerase